MLALVAFAMSMAGTFLVRSGILTSVHAFAVDPERGAFILALMLLYTGAAFVLFALRIGTVKQGEPFQLVSREGGIVANNIFLSVILADRSDRHALPTRWPNRDGRQDFRRAALFQQGDGPIASCF